MFTWLTINAKNVEKHYVMLLVCYNRTGEDIYPVFSLKLFGK